jgi:membrane protein DedA with SNARE-associated domain
MQHWVASLGPPVLFLVVLLQQAGVPYPITPVLIVAGAVSVHGHLPAGAVIGLAVAAALIADLGWYTAGYRLGGRALKALCALSLSPDSCVSDTERWFGRFGTRVLVIAKFVPGLGLVSTAMAGVARAGLEGFFLYDLIGNLLWASTAVYAGVLFHDAVGDILQVLAELGYWGVALLVVALAAVAHLGVGAQGVGRARPRARHHRCTRAREPAARRRDPRCNSGGDVATRLRHCNSSLRRGGDRLLRVSQ